MNAMVQSIRTHAGFVDISAVAALTVAVKDDAVWIVIWENDSDIFQTFSVGFNKIKMKA